MNDLNNLSGKKIIIYGFGITGKWLSTIINCEFIVDTDIKKWNNTFQGNKVFSPDELGKINKKEYIVVITTVDIFDVVPLLI